MVGFLICDNRFCNNLNEARFVKNTPLAEREHFHPQPSDRGPFPKETEADYVRHLAKAKGWSTKTDYYASQEGFTYDFCPQCTKRHTPLPTQLRRF